MKLPPGMAAVLRRCTKWVRDANFLASSRVSLCSPALSEPAQNVSPLCGLSTAFRNQAMSSSLVTIRGKPSTWKGGSSGCTHIFTPYSSHTRHDGGKEIPHVLAERIAVDTFVQSQQIPEYIHRTLSPSLMLPFTNPCVFTIIASTRLSFRLR